MLTNRNKRLVAFAFAAAFIFMAVSPALSVAADVPSDINVGPYIDKLVYKVIKDPSQTILALQAGTIEMDNSFFNPSYLPQLGADPDIEVFEALRNGYGHITINCDKYPLNISAFRRAFAFAFDQEKVTIDVMGGFSQEHDSLVPYPNGWCIEDDFTYHYYSDQTSEGQAILEAAGFEIDPATDFLLAPDGSPFDVTIQYGANSEEIAGATARIGAEALQRLGVNAHAQASDFNEYISNLDSHGDYDMVFYALNFYSNDVDWLAYEYWSEYADVDYQNPTAFRNETYDDWRDQLLYGTTYEQVEEAAAAMQEILHYNVPRLVVYENKYMQGYRNDKFTGHVEDLGRYISGPWTMRKIQNIDGSFGGTVPVGLGEEPDSFNIFVTNSAYAAAINTELWSSLYTFGPDLNPWPDLAEGYIVETHSDNDDVPAGHTRFTIDVIQNASWSDGVQLTANDVAFSISYAFESSIYGNPAGTDIGDLVAAYAPTPYKAVIEFNTESYWHFSNFAYDTIIPEHVFNDVDGIGYEGWNTWNPVFDPAEPNVNCGPYQITDFEAGEFYELTYNPLFHYAPERPDIVDTTTTEETIQTFDPVLAIVAGAVGAAVVILVGGFVLLRQK
ncbi:MAG: ABC transporter substrate-binding protein [Candidatus Thorarchaeota archaeon]